MVQTILIGVVIVLLIFDLYFDIIGASISRESDWYVLQLVEELKKQGLLKENKDDKSEEERPV